jgi:hypothetical protein
MTLLGRAFIFAADAHRAQIRKGSRLPYFVHPVNIMNLMNDFGIDPTLFPELHIVACLHDTIEDTDVTYENIRDQYGKDIADIVHELTYYGENKDIYMDSFYNCSTEALIVKLFDRISNILDYYKSDDPYWVKYSLKGLPVFQAFNKRTKEISNYVKEKSGLEIESFPQIWSKSGLPDMPTTFQG